MPEPSPPDDASGATSAASAADVDAPPPHGFRAMKRARIDAVLAERHRAQGAGAVFTDSGHAIQILRKVMVRIGAKLDWLILKLH